MSFPPTPDPLPAPVVDSHCHLDIAAEVTGLDAAEAIARASAAGVPRIVQIGCDLPGARWAVEAAARWPGLVAGVALHPNEVARLGATELATALAQIETLAVAPGVRAVGETGLDFFRTEEAAGQATQREAFAAHVDLARRYDRTLVIHDRDAHQAVLDVLDAADRPDRIVMHCFSGDAEFARACLDRGAYLSYAGPVTYKPNDHLRDALRITPLDRLLVETDAPFLPPVPHRGRPHATFLMPTTVRAMAEIRGADLLELCGVLDQNAEVAFGGPWGSQPGWSGAAWS